MCIARTQAALQLFCSEWECAFIRVIGTVTCRTVRQDMYMYTVSGDLFHDNAEDTYLYYIMYIHFVKNNVKFNCIFLWSCTTKGDSYSRLLHIILCDYCIVHVHVYFHIPFNCQQVHVHTIQKGNYFQSALSACFPRTCNVWDHMQSCTFITNVSRSILFITLVHAYMYTYMYVYCTLHSPVYIQFFPYSTCMCTWGWRVLKTIIVHILQHAK